MTQPLHQTAASDRGEARPADAESRGLERTLIATGSRMRGAMDAARPFGADQLRSLRQKLAAERPHAGTGAAGATIAGAGGAGGATSGGWIAWWRGALLVAAALFLLGAVAMAVLSVPLRASFSGRVHYAAGGGTVVPADGALYAGTRLATMAGGGVEFDVGPHASLYLGEESRIVIDGPDQVTLEAGVVWTSVKAGHGDFRVATADATVHVVGTAFEVAADGAATMVDLVKGHLRIEAAASGERRDLEAGGAMTIAGASMQQRDGRGAPPAWVLSLNRESLTNRDLKYFPSATVLDAEDTASSSLAPPPPDDTR
jgi:hypothetical protein